MKNILIKMSRRRSLMVPVVTLLAIGIGISGYYIQNRQIVAREQEEQSQEDEKDKPSTVDISGISTVETVEESTKVTEDGEAAKVVNIELEVENRPENSEVILRAKVDSKERGICAFYLKQGNYGPEDSIVATDGNCEARLQNPGIGTWEAKILYTSDDGKTRGDAKQDIEL